MADLREAGFLERLKLATSHHVYVSAYRITPEGKKIIKSFDKKHHESVDKIIKCKKCNTDMKIQAKEDAPYLICNKCTKEEKVDIFDIDEVAYISSPIFSEIWLPPDSKK